METVATVTLMAHVLPAGTANGAVMGQAPPVRTNSVRLAPLKEIPNAFKGELPVLPIVTLCGGEVNPSATAPKSRLVGSRVMIGVDRTKSL